MAEARTFTEGEMYALVADAVKRETAAAEAKAAELETEKVSLGNEKDALEVRATAAEAKAASAEQELADYKEQIETEKAKEAKRSERVAALADAAPALTVEGERADRIVAMADEDFAEYLGSLREIAATSKHAFKGSGTDCSTCGQAKGAAIHEVKGDGDGDADDREKSKEIPRQSAAFGGNSPGNKDTNKGKDVTKLFAARAALSAPKS